MKIRNDYVSNSSSSSFIAFEPEKRKVMFNGMKKNTLNYPEFMANLDYYDSMVFKYDDEHKEIVDKFLEFAKGNEHMSIIDPMGEIWSTTPFCDYMEKMMWKIYDIKEVESTDEKLLRIKKTLPWIKCCDYYYNGKKLDICNRKDIIETFGFDKNFRYVTISTGEWTVGYRGDKKYVLYPFVSRLIDSEMDNFLDSIVGMFAYVEGDEYDDCDTRPSELKVLEKYNN